MSNATSSKAVNPAPPVATTLVLAPPAAAAAAVAAPPAPAIAAPAAAAPEPPRPPFTIEVADRLGHPLGPDTNGFSDPGAPQARTLVFDVHTDAGPTTADMELVREFARIEHAIGELYPDGDDGSERRFRPYFVRLFYLAQLTLEGDVGKDAAGRKIIAGTRLPLEVAKAELAAVAADLIDDEAPRVKNRRLHALLKWASALAGVFVVAYVVLALSAQSAAFVALLRTLRIEASVAPSFMLLWVGTFIGVCLSYAIRTHSFTVSDLTRDQTDDYLAPQYRLLLAGTFAALIAMLAVVGLGDIEFGTIKMSTLATNAQLALVIGAILGISEKALSGTVEKRAGALFGDKAK